MSDSIRSKYYMRFRFGFGSVWIGCGIIATASHRNDGRNAHSSNRYCNRDLNHNLKHWTNLMWWYKVRDETMEYSRQLQVLGKHLFQLLSEALGLKHDHLEGMDCAKGHLILSHYYPACPEPELTMGTTRHSDPDFLTILIQDQIGGLQVLNQNEWIDVPPVPGALVVNIGDLLQLISNDKFKSVEHRVLANHRGPRVSVACFLTPHLYPTTRVYGPIKELLSQNNPPVYRETSLQDFVAHYNNKGLDGKSALAYFKLLQ
ncbi:hypothetical protein Lal_00035164 [Lupinus albus]|nr:hypothetical protein Lal_00035164 [Lupinus albus]